MPVTDLAPGDPIRVPREAPVVCIPLYGAHDFFVRCLSSVLEHTSTDVPILIADDAGPDPASRTWIDELAEQNRLAHRVFYLRQQENVGFVRNVNRAFAAAPTADVVVLNSDCVVAAEWLARLRAAAYSDTLVATASTLTNHGTIVSVPHRNRPVEGLPQDTTFDAAAAAVRERSPRLWPRIPTAIGHCMYIRRAALELAGDFDEAFSPAYGEEVDFSQRCIVRGLVHVVADDVLVYHHGSASLGREGRNPLQDEHEQIVRDRYPFYETAVEEAETTAFGRLPRALAFGRRAIGALTVTVDGRCLNPFVTGTQIHTLELIHALWRTHRIRLRVLLPPDVGGYAVHTLDRMPDVERVIIGVSDPAAGRTDLVHRPYQLSGPQDLPLLNAAGERLVVTHQDLIAYRNPGYFASAAEWQTLRRLTRESLALADHVLFFSANARDDAMAEDLLEPERHSVVHIGVDHRLGSLQPEPAPPVGYRYLETEPFVLCLGTDFHHKNRLFALKVLAQLRRRHGWLGRLVLAGPKVRYGSSAADEAAWRLEHPDVADAAIDLPAVNEAEKAWLYERATAVVYPTVSEGFGLVPFEAAAAGTPCLFARQASLAEVLPEATATLVPWDPASSADASIDVLTSPDVRREMVQEIHEAAERLTWDRTALRVLDAYTRTLVTPSREAARMAADGLEVECRLNEMESRYWGLWNEIGPTGLSLVGPDGKLPIESQRILAALSRRPATGAPLNATLRVAHRMSRGFRGGRGDRNGSG